MLRDSQTQSFFLLAQAGGARKARILVPAGQDLNYSPSAETPIPNTATSPLPACCSVWEDHLPTSSSPLGERKRNQ